MFLLLPLKPFFLDFHGFHSLWSSLVHLGFAYGYQSGQYRAKYVCLMIKLWRTLLPIEALYLPFARAPALICSNSWSRWLNSSFLLPHLLRADCLHPDDELSILWKRFQFIGSDLRAFKPKELFTLFQ